MCIATPVSNTGAGLRGRWLSDADQAPRAGQSTSPNHKIRVTLSCSSRGVIWSSCGAHQHTDHQPQMDSDREKAPTVVRRSVHNIFVSQNTCFPFKEGGYIQRKLRGIPNETARKTRTMIRQMCETSVVGKGSRKNKEEEQVIRYIGVEDETSRSRRDAWPPHARRSSETLHTTFRRREHGDPWTGKREN